MLSVDKLLHTHTGEETPIILSEKRDGGEGDKIQKDPKTKSLKVWDTRNLFEEALCPPLNTPITGNMDGRPNHACGREFLQERTTEAVRGLFIMF